MPDATAARRRADFQTRERAWRALRYFSIYRLIIASVFAALSLSDNLPPNFTEFDPRVFKPVAITYLVLAIVAQFVAERRMPTLRLQSAGQMLLDILGITLFMYASGGTAGGFGILLVVSIAGGCLLASWRAAIFYAALASLAVLGETLFGVLNLHYSPASYTQAGLLGAALFGTAMLSSILADQARRSEALAAQRGVAIEQLSRLNEHIVQRMRSGIVVVDDDGRIVLINESGGRMLRLAGAVDGQTIGQAAPLLAAARDEWLVRGENRKTPVITEPTGGEAIVSFTSLGPSELGYTLAFLEDAAETRQRAQQIKLASLGRLTASIAHEIRNPLGAISHAGQLLSESPDLGAPDQRLLRIINENCTRMNDIVSNVMMIGRRESAIAESFELRPWLESFVAELCARRALAAADVALHWPEARIVVRMDRSQLHQVLWNLCENALRYSTRRPLLSFDCGQSPDSGRPYLEVRDTGPGMTPAVAEQIFEPFFTGESNGTGLGLYIARELCEANQASLALTGHGAEGCRFRIDFAHPHRQQLTF
ncbi:MAG: PAS domain-containing protein [Gammaproteobacteria bacterium]|nr:PAS domain-containing protein [Gammaproteobacteria bacterium]